MQIDGHHALTYIAARCAGWPHDQASIIAHAAQYVDDATEAGLVRFDNGAMYRRIASAHKMLDYRNTIELANHQVWIPFHFLPGNGGLPAGENPDGSFIRKLVCHPDSPVARDMLRAAAADLGRPRVLHRIGIAMHVYADTWSHQGFAGVNHEINEVHDLSSDNLSLDQWFFDKIKNYFVSEALPLGHGAALSYPDRPALVWEYTNGLGERIHRDNPHTFLDAVDHMCRALRCFRNGDATMDLEAVPGLPEADAHTVLELLRSIEGDSGEQRHAQWLAHIHDGAFSFGPARPAYIATGPGSWKRRAIGLDCAGDAICAWSPAFMSSDWKLFHDALQAHRLAVLHDVLPAYGICAA